MTAKEFLKTATTDLRAKNPQLKGEALAVRLMLDFGESYASHVLQEYKKELAEWVESQANFISDDDDIKDRYARSAYREVLTKLKEE